MFRSRCERYSGRHRTLFALRTNVQVVAAGRQDDGREHPDDGRVRGLGLRFGRLVRVEQQHLLLLSGGEWRTLY